MALGIIPNSSFRIKIRISPLTKQDFQFIHILLNMGCTSQIQTCRKVSLNLSTTWCICLAQHKKLNTEDRLQSLRHKPKEEVGNSSLISPYPSISEFFLGHSILFRSYKRTRLEYNSSLLKGRNKHS